MMLIENVNSRAGAPTTHSIASRIANSTSAVPRSRPTMTSSVIARITGTTGIMIWCSRPSRRSFLA